MIIPMERKDTRPTVAINQKKQVFADRRTRRERDRSANQRKAIQRSFRGE